MIKLKSLISEIKVINNNYTEEMCENLLQKITDYMTLRIEDFDDLYLMIPQGKFKDIFDKWNMHEKCNPQELKIVYKILLQIAKKIGMTSIDEITTYQKPIYGSGAEHNIYSSKRDPHKLFKVWKYKSGNYKEKIEEFKAFPQIFPKVYKVTDTYAIIEKLDTSKVTQELNSLKKNIDFPTRFHDITSIIHNYITTGNKDVYEKYIKNISNSPIYQKYVDYIKYVMKTIGDSSDLIPVHDLDFNDGNFAYTPQGNLKMIDI